MPPRDEEELDPVTLHNQACCHLNFFFHLHGKLGTDIHLLSFGAPTIFTGARAHGGGGRNGLPEAPVSFTTESLSAR